MLLNVVSIVAFVCCVAAFGFSALLLISSRRRLESAIDKHITDRANGHQQLIQNLIRTIKPRVVHCSRREDVTREAVEIIREAVERRKEYERGLNVDQAPTSTTSDSGDQSTMIHSDADQSRAPHSVDFISFYGAANLSGEHRTPDHQDHVEEHVGQYRKALSDAVQQELRIRRYIHLFSGSELTNRKPEFVRDYFQWLARQYDALRNDPGFQLVNNPRVPQWGANSATLVTHNAVMEIKGNGTAAVSVHDSSIAATVRLSLRAARNEAMRTNETIYESNPAGLGELAKHIRKELNDYNVALKQRAETAHLSLALAEVIRDTIHLRAWYEARGESAAA